MITNAIHLMNYENRYGETIGDKIMIMRDLTLVNSAGSINLAGIVKEGAVCQYFIVQRATITTGALAVEVTAGATEAVTVAIIVDPRDLV